MTSANRTGVRSGTRSSRGVRTLSANRRCTRVLSARALRGGGGARGCGAGGGGGGGERGNMGSPFGSGGADGAPGGGGGSPRRGGGAGWELGRVRPDLVDREHGGVRGRSVQRDSERATERERVVGRHTVRAQPRERSGRVFVDSKFEHLGSERPQQCLRPVESDDPPRVHARHALAEALGLVEGGSRKD